jgi:hypothetical protein
MMDLIIVQKKIDKKHSDSFWYDGLIASIGKYNLIASGEIDITFKENENNYKNDRAVEEAMHRKLTDKNINNAIWDNNNWFEVVDNDGNGVLGDVAYDYDEGITLLKQYYNEKIYG